MKLSAVYKSLRKVDTYLYIQHKDDFSKVPQSLMQQFGEPQFVMQVPLDKRERVAGIHVDTLMQKLQDDGFYLQLPPTAQSLLKAHLTRQENTNKAAQ